jgi:uncharacterized protein YoxC
MAADVSREEFQALERQIEGEKLVTRHVLEQTHRNSDDLAAIRTRLDRVEGKVDGVAQDVGGLRVTVERLVRELPKIVGDAIRNASPRRGRKT